MTPNTPDPIDQILNALAHAEPPLGMDTRILHALESHTLQPASAARLPWLRWKPILAFSLAAATILITVAILHHPHHPKPAMRPIANSLPTTHNPLQMNAEDARKQDPMPQLNPLPAAHHLGNSPTPPTPFRWASTTPPHPASKTLSSFAAGGGPASPSTLVSYPAPPMPLTTQEKLLLRIAHHDDPQSLAPLTPVGRAAEQAHDKAAFQDFFPPPTPVDYPTLISPIQPTRCTRTTPRSLQMKYVRTLLAFTLALCTVATFAQAKPDSAKPEAQPDSAKPGTAHYYPEDTRPLRTFTLQAGSTANDGNEVLTAIRLLVEPDVKLYLTPSANTISVRATPTQIQLIEKILSEVDQPRHAYRLTYTITEMDGTKRIGIQNFAVVVAAGGRTTLKDGSKIPIVTGSNNKQSKEPDTVFTYLDIGLNINASLDEFANGARLQSKIEQSSAAENTTIAGVTEPIIRQSVLEGTSFLTPGKPLTLGAFDIPGSTRHLEVAVTMDPVH